MIDNPVQVERLIAKLRAALPLSATATPPLVALLKEEAVGIDLSPSCQITGIHYAGDEGGIVCKLDFGNEPEQKVFFASITHLAFDRRLPLAREIAGYQKHRLNVSSAPTRARPPGPITERRSQMAIIALIFKRTTDRASAHRGVRRSEPAYGRDPSARTDEP